MIICRVTRIEASPVFIAHALGERLGLYMLDNVNEFW